MRCSCQFWKVQLKLYDKEGGRQKKEKKRADEENEEEGDRTIPRSMSV